MVLLVYSDMNYGGVLALNKEPKKAIKILEEAKKVSSEPDLYISCG